MAWPWTIELSSLAQKNLAQLDRQTSKRILDFLHKRVAKLDDPRGIGSSLKGDALGDYWKYRVGDWRVIARIEDRVLRVLVVRIGHRSDVYRH